MISMPCRQLFTDAHAGAAVPLRFAAPGRERQDSVFNGFQARTAQQSTTTLLRFASRLDFSSLRSKVQGIAAQEQDQAYRPPTGLQDRPGPLWLPAVIVSLTTLGTLSVLLSSLLNVDVVAVLTALGHAVQEIQSGAELVAIHDSARPLVTADETRRCCSDALQVPLGTAAAVCSIAHLHKVREPRPCCCYGLAPHS